MDICGLKESRRLHVQARKFLFDALDISPFFTFVTWMTCDIGLEKFGKSRFCEAHEVSLHIKAEAGMEKWSIFFFLEQYFLYHCT